MNSNCIECGPIASVVIPAHNEQAVLGRCLKSLLGEAEPGELEVVVVCNSCPDQTQQVARSFGPDVCVVETPFGSKTGTLMFRTRQTLHADTAPLCECELSSTEPSSM